MIITVFLTKIMNVYEKKYSQKAKKLDQLLTESLVKTVKEKFTSEIRENSSDGAVKSNVLSCILIK